MAGKRDPSDINELAYRIVTDLTGESEGQPNSVPLRSAAGRKGGKKGGPARAQKLTPSERSAIAKKAARARWKQS
jgi:hypothetical protein